MQDSTERQEASTVSRRALLKRAGSVAAVGGAIPAAASAQPADCRMKWDTPLKGELPASLEFYMCDGYARADVFVFNDRVTGIEIDLEDGTGRATWGYTTVGFEMNLNIYVDANADEVEVCGHASWWSGWWHEADFCKTGHW